MLLSGEMYFETGHEALCNSVQDIVEPEARAAFVWILGEYGQSIQVCNVDACPQSWIGSDQQMHCSDNAHLILRRSCNLYSLPGVTHSSWSVRARTQGPDIVSLRVQDAPYLLEPLAEGFVGEPVRVRLALLAAAMKLFFRRPPECRALLGAVLAAACADANQDVHDRALLYYRCRPLWDLALECDPPLPGAVQMDRLTKVTLTCAHGAPAQTRMLRLSCKIWCRADVRELEIK